jgi:autotransporter-associated beta strand protein
MKKILRFRLLLVLLTAVATPLLCSAQITPTNFFGDTFGNGSTINSATPAPPGTNFASYEEISGKTWSPTPSVNPNDLQFGIAATTSGADQIQALFATNVVNLVAPGTDYIQMVIVFTNTSGGLLTVGQGYLGVGLYNSGSSTNYPVPGGLNGNETSSATTAVTENAATWAGYFAQIAFSGSTTAILTRPAQNGPNNNNQDLLTTGSGTYSFAHPTGSTLTSFSSTLILGTNVPYTEVFEIWLNTPGSEVISNYLYAGSTISGTPLTQIGGVATNTTFLTGAFNALGFGWYQKNNAHANTVDISSINVSGYSTPVNGPPAIPTQPSPLVVATNGYGEFSLVAQGFNVTYQWFRNGAPLANGGDIAGATTSTLIVSPAQSQDAFSGNNGYYCHITGAEGFSTNSTTNSLTLVPATNVTWTASSSTTWDVDTTPNFVDPNNNPAVFTGGDSVVFNDTAGNEDVSLSGNLGPSLMTVTTGQAYTFAGSGSIVGPGSVVLSGTGSPNSGEAILNANNTYSGGTILTNGIYVQLGNYGGLGAGPVTLNEAGGEMEIVPAGSASSGIPGEVIVSNNFSILPDVDSTFAVVFLGDLSGASGATLSIAPSSSNPNTNVMRIRAYGTSTVYNGNLDVAANMVFAPYSPSGSQTYNGMISDSGAFMEKGTITYLNGPNTYSGGTYPAQGAIGLGNNSALGTGPLYLMPDSTTSLTGNGQIFASAANITIGNAIQYPTGTNNLTLEVGGTNNLTLSGPFTLQGNDGVTTNTITSRGFIVTNTALTTISGIISDGGKNYGFNVSGNGVLALNNTETYTGPTTISNATLLVDGQIGSGAVTVATNATLGGVGKITGPVSVLNFGTLAAGDQGVGKLTVNNSVTFAAGSTAKVNVSGTANSASEVAANSVTYAGTLFATNISGTLSAGQNFTIFSGTSSGNFSSIAGRPGFGLTWSFNASSGVLSVVGIATDPTNITFSASGGKLNLSWPADHLGWTLQVQTNSVTRGLSTNWVTVPNSTLVDSTNFPIASTNGVAFYRLMYQ